MKLASLKGGRDGRLVVVSGDLVRCADASAVAPTLQSALDNWVVAAPMLSELSIRLNKGECESTPFNEADCLAPLPRAYQWLDASAYVNHVKLARMARGAEIPDSFWTDPLMYQGGSDAFLAPHEPIAFPDEDGGIDFEAEIGVVLGDVPMDPSYVQAAASIRLFVLVNDVSLRTILVREIKKDLGLIQAKPPSTLSPVMATPDELGKSWDGGRLHLPLRSYLNGQLFGCPNAGIDMTFDFPTLIMHAAKTRRLTAGTIIGSGTISNRGPDGGAGRPIGEGGVGYSCLAEIRATETLRAGRISTPFMRFGDRIDIEMSDSEGRSIFGKISQQVVRSAPPDAK